MAEPSGASDVAGRPDADDGVAEFARDLQALRVSAGAPSYADLSRSTGIARSTLYDGMTGTRLPSLELVIAVVEALGADVDGWRERWTDIRVATVVPDPTAGDEPATGEPRSATGELHGEAPAPRESTDDATAAGAVGAGAREGVDADAPLQAETPTPRAVGTGRPRRPRRRWILVGAVVVLAAAGVAGWRVAASRCDPAEQYVMTAAGELDAPDSAVVDRLEPGDTVTVLAKKNPYYEYRYRVRADRSGREGYIDEAKIDYRGPTCA